MSVFPFFVELDGAEGLIVGGGEVAARKAEKLLPYGPRLTIAAARIHPRLEALRGVTLVRADFSPALLAGKLFVIAATDDRAVNHEISALCRARAIPVNVVDDKSACTFLFPSLVKEGELSVGISTGGASPSAAIYMKERIQTCLPENIGSILHFLREQRENVRETLPPREREAAFKRLFERCLERGGPLSETELAELLGELAEEKG